MQRGLKVTEGYQRLGKFCKERLSTLIEKYFWSKRSCADLVGCVKSRKGRGRARDSRCIDVQFNEKLGGNMHRCLGSAVMRFIK